MNILLLAIFFSAATSGYAEESVGLKKDDAYTTSQKQALKQWKTMRKESEVSESAGKKSVFSIFTQAKKTKKRSKSKTGKTKSEKAKNAKPGKARNSVEKNSVDSSAKSRSNNAEKAKTPDGSTRSQ